MPASSIYMCAAMLFLAIAPLPYGYYTLLRIVTCGVFTFAAFIAYERKRELLPWFYGLIALLFNPIIKIHFSKEIWMVIDIATAIFILATSPSIKSAKQFSGQAKG